MHDRSTMTALLGPMAGGTLLVLASSLLTAGAWAGPPGEVTKGSTTTTISAGVDDLDECLVSEAASASDSDGGATAWAMAKALSHIEVSYAGDVTLDLTRHGKNGAVHKIDLSAEMGSGILYAQVAKSKTSAEASASASAEAEVEANAEAIAEALASVFIGIDETAVIGLCPICLEVTVKIGAQADAEADATAVAHAEASASAEADAAAGGESSAKSLAKGEGSSTFGSTVHIHGAHIEEFHAQLSAQSHNGLTVKTKALAQTYADALATAMVYALAEASAEAEASLSLTFEFDLPILGQGSLPIVTDFDSASDSAQEIMQALETIAAHAQAMAEASAKTMAESEVGVNLSVDYENLPGTEDLLEAAAAGNLSLLCNAAVSAEAEAEAD